MLIVEDFETLPKGTKSRTSFKIEAKHLGKPVCAPPLFFVFWWGCLLFIVFFFLSAKTSFLPAAPNSMKTVLVYFLGGCTFAEVAALRMLAQRESKQHTL